MVGVQPVCGRHDPLRAPPRPPRPSRPGARPVRFDTRKMWVSTAMVGSPKAMLRTTLAVLRPTPGSSCSASRRARHLAAMLGDQLSRQRDDVLRLGAEEADGADQFGDPVLAERRHLLRRVGGGEQGRRRLVDPGVGRLRRQDDGDEQGEGAGVVQLALRLGQAFWNRANISAMSARGIFRARPAGFGRGRRACVAASPSAGALVKSRSPPSLPRSPAEAGRDVMCRFESRRPCLYSVAMTSGNAIADAEDRPIFSARLTPHRSLSPTGFMLVMMALVSCSFTAGLAFWMMGAWPVVGFFGLDILLVQLAFRLNYRAARASEEVNLFRRPADRAPDRAERQMDRVQPQSLLGAAGARPPSRRSASPASISPPTASASPIASFLGPHERESFAAALSAALAEARAGAGALASRQARKNRVARACRGA